MSETVALVTSIVSCLTVVVTLLSPCVREHLSEQYSYLRKRKDNLKALEMKLKNLKSLIATIDEQFKGKKLRKCDDYSTWKKAAEDFSKEVAESNFKVATDRTCCGLPNCCSQYEAGNNVAKKVKQLDEIMDQGKFFTKTESSVVGYMRTTTELVGEKTKSAVEKIWKSVIEKEEVGTICVYGMACLGKTAVVTEINNRALKVKNKLELEDRSNTVASDDKDSRELFDKVIWVSVAYESSQPSIEKLQKDIAKRIPVDLNVVTDKEERANILLRALSVKRFLLILDDMWKDFSLEEVCIPRPTNGSKVIIISRSLPVCSSIKIDEKIKIEPLSDEEAWKLFVNEADKTLDELKNQETKVDIKDLVKECERLPLVIIMVARALKDIRNEDTKDVDTSWSDALKMLRENPAIMESVNKKSFARLISSYEMLNEKTRSCFLYCALFPMGHHIQVKKLMEYWLWEGLLDDVPQIEDSMKRVGQVEDKMKQASKIVDELKDAYFLEVVSQGEQAQVKMPNLVWHMAVHLTNERPHFFIKAGTELTKFPLEGDWPEDVERASLMGNQFIGLRGEPNCPKLITLLLQHNPIPWKPYEHFFHSMPNLQILDLSFTEISSLPKSFTNLGKLRGLLLRNCPKLKCLPSLEKCRKLIVLDLSYSPIEQLPNGMEQLTNLVRLNLSHTRVEELPSGLVPKLTQLQELLMMANNSSYLWGPKHMKESEEACIEELAALQNLAILQIHFLNAEAFDEFVNEKHNCPPNFIFCVGGFCGGNLPKNSVLISDFLVKAQPVSLPKQTSQLHVWNNSDLNLLHIACHLQNLQLIDMFNCEDLEYLFEVKTLQFLPNLKRILVSQCKKMEAVIKSDGSNSTKVMFQRLEELVLSELPMLKDIYRGEMKWDSLKNIVLWKCDALKMTPSLESKVKRERPTSEFCHQPVKASPPAELSRKRGKPSSPSRSCNQEPTHIRSHSDGSSPTTAPSKIENKRTLQRGNRKLLDSLAIDFPSDQNPQGLGSAIGQKIITLLPPYLQQKWSGVWNYS
ncbi:Disease resistance protein [Quillaja saponaria]|uniref:Disease resistance protein n=1 Tax=Quillaja saponaria TaxID=32244 RepID=A0AAD7P985_QUISA|nr:Disease resistance protein [Quillaja saponaria]